MQIKYYQIITKYGVNIMSKTYKNSDLRITKKLFKLMLMRIICLGLSAIGAIACFIYVILMFFTDIDINIVFIIMLIFSTILYFISILTNVFLQDYGLDDEILKK